jgi:hypothetical protein
MHTTHSATIVASDHERLNITITNNALREAAQKRRFVRCKKPIFERGGTAVIN